MERKEMIYRTEQGGTINQGSVDELHGRGVNLGNLTPITTDTDQVKSQHEQKDAVAS